jgi:galactokinase
VSTVISTIVTDLFSQHFGQPDLIVRSPGRINLIGEHTDYNMGFVLPASIDKAIYIAIGKRNDTEIHLLAADLDEKYQTTLDQLLFSDKHWPNYVMGVVDQLQKAGHSLKGFNAVLSGDVPLGAGLSSSAAVECATAFALNDLFSLGLDRLTMVQLSQKAENQFVGVQCGIMDQFASMFGREEKLIRLDCRSLAYEYIPFPTETIEVLLMDTGVKHSLASTEYNQRREECETGVSIIRQQYPEVNSLRDATSAMVETVLSGGDTKVYHRCKYIVEEIERLQLACADLQQRDLHAFGQKMFATHDGLSRLYEVSCPEADALVDMVRNDAKVYGARMMGGGFGGCTINIVEKGYAPELAERTAPVYLERFGKEMKWYIVQIDKGTSIAQ